MLHQSLKWEVGVQQVTQRTFCLLENTWFEWFWKLFCNWIRFLSQVDHRWFFAALGAAGLWSLGLIPLEATRHVDKHGREVCGETHVGLAEMFLCKLRAAANSVLQMKDWNVQFARNPFSLLFSPPLAFALCAQDVCKPPQKVNAKQPVSWTVRWSKINSISVQKEIHNLLPQNSWQVRWAAFNCETHLKHLSVKISFPLRKFRHKTRQHSEAESSDFRDLNGDSCQPRRRS